MTTIASYDAAGYSGAGSDRIADIYSDLNGLEAIKTLGLKDREGAMAELAQQFEALLVKMMLSSMRSANEVFGEDNPLNSSESQMYQDMLDQQLTVSLSQGGGIGLADIIRRQLDPSAGGARADGSSPAALPDREIRPAANRASRSTRDWEPGGPGGFVDQLRPLAQSTAAELGVSAEILLSQAALETGWGQHVLRTADGQPSFNFFNIKAGRDWQGDVVNVPTLEYRDGVAVREWAAFRAYQTPAEGFADYAALVRDNPRYQAAIDRGADPASYIRELAAAGYATDPRYADKVLAVMNSASIGGDGAGAAQDQPGTEQ